ncbi:MAG: hypothetical protein CSA81_09150 [Acidobacteria bacterium]|nr:MAG: hypothetical protein CSA81_09150 [Acidobacteriota bacterium]
MSKQTARSTAGNIGELLCDSGFETRFAGGCVRDELLGLVPRDYDLATTALPETVARILKPMGMKVIPTGVSHGTVTVVHEGIPTEVTTLRRDIRCDGRRAVVAFSTSFEEDAHRRDFTINALFKSMTGKIYDYVNGVRDLQNKNLLFVGRASRRIQEDSLRIIRYFRFISRYGWTFHQPYRDIFIKSRKRLTILSKERIKSEFDELLMTDTGKMLSVMDSLQLFPFLFDGMLQKETLESDLFSVFPAELQRVIWKWYVLFSLKYPESSVYSVHGRKAKLTKKQILLLSSLQEIICSLKQKKTGMVPLLSAIHRKLTEPEEVLHFLSWYSQRFQYTVPDITRNLLTSMRGKTIPPIGKYLKMVQPPEKRKQIAFIFKISWYLGLCQPGDVSNPDKMIRLLQQRGFQMEREFNGIKI